MAIAHRYAVYKAGIVNMQVPVVHGLGACASSRSHIIPVRYDAADMLGEAGGAGPSATAEPAAVLNVKPDDGARRLKRSRMDARDGAFSPSKGVSPSECARADQQHGRTHDMSY
jgi:hypothetical protein